MSFKNWSRVLRLLSLAVATLPAFSAERHNLILLVPAVLPAAATESYSTAPVDSTRDVEEAGPSLLTARFSDPDTRLDTIVDVMLTRFKDAKRPFVLVYRFGIHSDGPKDIARLLNRKSGGSDEPALVSAVITVDEALSEIEEKLLRIPPKPATDSDSSRSSVPVHAGPLVRR